ncbi:MAG: class I SAM-dependent methyltransferase [Parachlamydiales bacterium]|nr:class I SAM-dependent methyltransferase [Parachlamydiales bacterium]
MPQINNGIRSILGIGRVYDLFQWIIGANEVRRRFIQEFVCPKNRDALLDFGCGTGTILNYLPSAVQYYGVDISQEYINHAKMRFGERGIFVCSNVNNPQFLSQFPKFDLVIAFGLLHHLSDDEVINLFRVVKNSMKETGRCITLDNCFVKEQSMFARLIIKKDRGQNIRNKEGYEALATEVFSNVKTTILHDMLRVPYTHIILECSK